MSACVESDRLWRVRVCGEKVFGDRVRCGEKESVGSERVIV